MPLLLFICSLSLKFKILLVKEKKKKADISTDHKFIEDTFPTFCETGLTGCRCRDTFINFVTHRKITTHIFKDEHEGDGVFEFYITD